MSFNTSIYTLPLLLSSIASLMLAGFLWQRRAAQGATMLALAMFSASVWALAYMLELASPDLSVKILWAQVQYLGIVIVPVAWFLFALSYTGRAYKKQTWLLFLIPLITTILVWSNESHQLIWQNLGIRAGTSQNWLEVNYGLWFWAHSIYSYSLLSAGIIILLYAIWRDSRRYKQQVVTLILGFLFPMLANMVYVFSNGINLDLSPLSFTLGAGIIAFGMFRYQLLDLVPIAKSHVIDSLHEGVLVTDISGRVLDANPAACSLLSLERKATVGCTVSELFAKQPEVLDAFNNVIPEKIIDLANKSVELRLSPVNQGANQSGRVMVLRDVTERLATEAELQRAKEQAETANIAKTQFLGNMSHELRTPLTAINGFSELLAEGFAGQLNDKQDKFVQDILNSGNRLLELVDSVLNYTKLETEPTHFERIRFDVCSQLRNVSTQMQGQIKKSGNRLELELNDTLGSVYTNPDNLSYILRQLLDNASKFCADGVVRLYAKRLTAHDGDWLCISVSDTGIGIDPVHFEHIFTAFSQVDGSSTRRFGGSGLGLALCKRYAELLDGYIEVESTIGEGATFTLFVPYVPDAEAMKVLETAGT